jgi:hypothetical protein
MAQAQTISSRKVGSAKEFVEVLHDIADGWIEANVGPEDEPGAVVGRADRRKLNADAAIPARPIDHVILRVNGEGIPVAFPPGLSRRPQLESFERRHLRMDQIDADRKQS